MKITAERLQIKDIMHLLSLNDLNIHLFQKKSLRHTMRGIKSKNHKTGTYETNETSISCFDDKRYVLKNGIDTLAYGHKNILN